VIHRRAFIGAIGAGFVLGPLAAATPAAEKMPRVGLLITGSASGYMSTIEAFERALRDLGYVGGRNIAFEYQYAEGKYDRLPDLSAELIRRKVDVIVTHGAPGALAAKQATTTIPIVMAVVGDAVAAGVVPSLARPGGNITGSSFFYPELTAKRLELLREILPGVVRIAVLIQPDNPGTRSALSAMEVTARSLGLELQPVEVRHPNDFVRAFSEMAQRRAQALAITDDAMLLSNPKPIADLADRSRLPTIGPQVHVEAGILLGYVVNLHDLWRRAAVFVDKILKGAKPADLPVEQPTKFELLINLKTAKSLGLTIPPALLLRADRIIE
jgi:ABC-type uncharacterized transport system substrate-binding protein